MKTLRKFMMWFNTQLDGERCRECKRWFKWHELRVTSPITGKHLCMECYPYEVNTHGENKYD